MLTGSSLPLIALIVAVIAIGIVAYKHFFPKSTAAAATPAVPAASAPGIIAEIGSKISAAAADIKAHVTSTVAKPAPAPTVGTANAPAAPAPAAPAASVAEAPPPVAAAPSAGPSVGAVGTAAAAAGPVWPHLISVGGVNIMASAPINPDWKPSQMAQLMGGPGHFVFEPSNGNKAVPPQPLRSAAGYPLVYALGAGGGVVGTASVLYGQETFNSDAEVAAFIAATTVTPAQAAASAAQWAAEDAALATRAAIPPVQHPNANPAPAASAGPGLAPSYANKDALLAAIATTGFQGAVTVSGVVVHAGFGKPDGSAWAYVTQPDGSVAAA